MIVFNSKNEVLAAILLAWVMVVGYDFAIGSSIIYLPLSE